MTDWLLGLVPQYGVYLLALSTFASCLALPIPASILMLAAGGFVASGDLTMTGTLGAALAGAIAGDQVGFLLGRLGGATRIGRVKDAAGPLAKATALLARRGGVAVFFTRWLISALGPYVNLAAGVAGMSWLRFSLWGAAGEAVWVGLYLSLGYGFTGNIEAASGMAASLLGFLAAGSVALGLGAWLLHVIRAERKTPGP